MDDIHTRHFAIIAIALIISVAIWQNYPIENLTNIIILLAGIVGIDKAIAVKFGRSTQETLKDLIPEIKTYLTKGTEKPDE